MTKLVIFDLDGTLVDTIEDIAACVNGALARYGFSTHDAAAYKRMVGDGFTELIRRALPPTHRTEVLVDELRREAAAAYEAAPVAASRPYPGIHELLAELSSRSIALAVLSNKPDRLAVRVVELLFPSLRFAALRGEGPGFPRKPDPSSALDICRQLGVSPEETLFVGDSAVDMETAHRAGFRSVGAAWGFRGAEELKEAGARHLIERPEALLELL